MKSINKPRLLNPKDILLSIVLLIVATYFIPLPIPIRATLQGTQENSNTTYNTISASIKGFEYKYAFKNNKIKATLTITPNNTNNVDCTKYTLLGNVFTVSNEPNVHWATMMYYSADLNQYTNATILFDNKFENIIVKEAKNNDFYYIASKNSNTKNDNLLNYIKEY